MKLNENVSRHISDAVAKICPIDGISTGTGGKLSWQIHFRPEATAEQRVAAQAVIDNFDLSDTAQVARQKAARKAEASAKLTSKDSVSTAVRNGLRAVRKPIRNKINEIIAAVKSGNTASLQPLPILTPEQEAALFAAELDQELDQE